MIGSRKIRITAALFVCASIVALLWPRAFNYVSTFAVVNAPVVTLHSPIDGTVIQASPQVSIPVRRTQTLIAVAATYPRAADLSRLEAEEETRGRRIAALIAESREVEGLAEVLKLRADRRRESERDYLSARLDEARAGRDAAAARLAQAETEMKRLKDRGGRSASAVRARRAAEVVVTEAQANVAAAEARIAGARVQAAALEAGDPLPGAAGGRDYESEREDEIALRLADIAARRASLEAESAGALPVINGLRRAVERNDIFRPIAAVDGVVWTASRQQGASVTAGTPLVQILDCSRRFVEVNLPENIFDEVSAGTLAEVRLRGSEKGWFLARVVSRHASAGGSTSAVDAAIPDIAKGQGMKVFLQIAPADPRRPGVAAAFCDVGRSAEVRIPRHTPQVIANSLSFLRQLWGAGRDAVAGSGPAPEPKG